MRITAQTLILAMVVSAVSCGTPAPRREFDRSFKTIALVSPTDIVNVAEIETRGDRAMEGAGKGAAAGSLGAAAVGAIACGPFLYGLCVSGLMLAGMIAGGATGVLYGLSGFPEDDARKLEQNLEILNQLHDFPSVLVEEISQEVAPQMLASPESAEIQAVLFIEDIEFRSEGSSVRLRTMVAANFESTESRRVPQYGTRKFAGLSGLYELEEWTDIESGRLEQAIRESLSAASVNIVNLLNDRWKPAADSR